MSTVDVAGVVAVVVVVAAVHVNVEEVVVVVRIVVVVVNVVTFEDEVVIVGWAQLASVPNNRIVANNVDIYLTIRFFISVN